MSKTYRATPVLLMLTILVTLTACGPGSKTVKDSAVSADISGLELDKSHAPTLVYVRPGAPTFATYNRFIIDPVKIDYKDPKMKELDPKEILEMQEYFLEAMTGALRDGGYEVGTRSEPGTMRISFTISGLKAPTAVPNVVAALAPIAITVGEVTVQAVFRDAMTNRIDAVAVDRSRGSHVINPSPWSTKSDIRASFKKWANGIRKAIDKAHEDKK